MKRILLSMICLIAVAATAVGQQAQDALYIYRNDGAFNAFFFADIDRMEYSKIDTMGVEQDEYVVQEIYALDSVFRIPISAIDSIGFVTPETQYKSDVSFRDDSELWDYVIASDSASYFLLDVAIPERLVPRVGDKLVAIRSREFFPQGVYGRVAEVAQVAEGIMVSFDPLDFTELFDTWVCKVAVASVKEGNEVKRVKRRSSEEAVDVTIPLTSLRYTIDLSNIGYGITNEITLSGSGLLDVGVEQNLRVRAFLMVRPLLGLNFDLVQRLETNRFFKLDLKGSISGQLDVPFNKTWFLIPDTPFAVETQAGISFSATGEVELGMERQQVTSLVTTVQYNNSFYDYDPTDDAGQVGGSVNDVFSQSENTFKGTVTLTAGPYYGVWFSVLKKEVVKIGMRYDAGVKAEYSLDFQGSDLLFAAIPATLPAYMLINPTGLYDILNRDGSVKIGPFCTGKIEAGIGPWKTDASFLDLSTKWRGFEGGVVPKFSNTSAWIDPADNKLYAKTGIERRVVNSMPVGFAAYYAKSGKQASTNWSKYEYSGHPVNTHFASKEYTLEMPLFGAGKAVRVYPLVRLPMFGYEMLCSPYKEMTIPVEVKADPERIEVSASTHEQRFTFTDNLDRNEDTYERTVEIKCEKPNESDPDWIHGHWDGEDYVIKVDANTTPDARWGFLHVTTANADKSVRERITISVYQLYPEESDIHVEPTSLLFDADGGKKSFKVFLGEKPQYDAAVSDEGKNWCSVAKTVGPAVEVSVKPNPSTEDRACFVTCWVGNDDGSEKVEMLVKVVQQGKTVEPEPEPEVNTNIQSIYFLSSVSTKTYTDGETGDENSAVDETLMSVGFNFTQENSTIKTSTHDNITHYECTGHSDLSLSDITCTLSFDIDNTTNQVSNTVFTNHGIVRQSVTMAGTTVNYTITTDISFALGDFPLSSNSPTYKTGKWTVADGLVFNDWSVTGDTYATYSDPEMSPVSYQTNTYYYLNDPANSVQLIIMEDAESSDTQWPADGVVESLKSAGMPVYEGTAPPTVNGIYQISPLSIVSDNIEAAEEVALTDGIVFRINGQANGEVDFNIYYIIAGTADVASDTMKGYIRGDGNQFTLCVPDGDGRAVLLSGEMENGNIKNCHFASASMTTADEHLILKDTDGNAESTFWSPGTDDEVKAKRNFSNRSMATFRFACKKIE